MRQTVNDHLQALLGGKSALLLRPDEREFVVQKIKKILVPGLTTFTIVNCYDGATTEIKASREIIFRLS
jgi:hypothetical protein